MRLLKNNFGGQILKFPRGISEFGRHSYLANFGPIGLNFFMGAQETFISRLVLRNPSYDAYFSFLIFWATFGGKMDVATMRALNRSRGRN